MDLLQANVNIYHQENKVFYLYLKLAIKLSCIVAVMKSSQTGLKLIGQTTQHLCLDRAVLTRSIVTT